MNKPVVQCSLVTPEKYLAIGCGALVMPYNHPNHLPGHDISGEHAVRTSRVVAIDLNTRRLETLNTIYEWGPNE